MINGGLGVDEYYVQFVPPATFGVIFDRATHKLYLVRANGEKTLLRRDADRIYTLRGFIGLRQRESRTLVLGLDVEDEIIRRILFSFRTMEDLCDSVRQFCPSVENADTINDVWGPAVFDAIDQGSAQCHAADRNRSGHRGFRVQL
jgi:hypothetical protein